MLERGLIEPAEGPWSSPVVLAKKKDGCLRSSASTTRDLMKSRGRMHNRYPGSMQRWMPWPVPTSGYWQVEVDKRDRKKTAFATPLGLYQLKVMPFGLCNAPGTFQRLMERTLSGLVVFSATEEEHLTRLEEVFQRLKGVGLKIKPEKCQLMKKQACHHTRGDRDRLTKNSGSLTVAHTPLREGGPLHELPRKGEKWQWGPRQEGAFTTLKNLLVSTLILGHPDFSRPFVLDVDASDTAIGAVLSQTMENGNQMEGDASAGIGRETVSSVFVRRKVHGSHGPQFPAVALKLPRTGRSGGALLAEYQFDVVHRPGKQHENADALSRQSCKQCGMGSPCQAISLNAISCEGENMIQQWQEDDPEIQQVIKWLSMNSWPDKAPEGSRILKSLWAQRRRMKMTNGVLTREWEALCTNKKTMLPVIPRARVPEVLDLIHNHPSGGH
ncbi:Retrovirus-related Pol polyprotein from transposon 17.6 [Trichinella murrelli]|uniref:Retrovirus-related Pol polyprotein from transposon 17.6 n=1 Tax=Trichinella murrelli TaxID=144512 RepID=A0A0V0T671_9BILA|nr:Retrovirus-related Pol polyprotein from transposon 17.6 [Trichinella murrelli]